MFSNIRSYLPLYKSSAGQATYTHDDGAMDEKMDMVSSNYSANTTAFSDKNYKKIFQYSSSSSANSMFTKKEEKLPDLNYQPVSKSCANKQRRALSGNTTVRINKVSYFHSQVNTNSIRESTSRTRNRSRNANHKEESRKVHIEDDQELSPEDFRKDGIKVDSPLSEIPEEITQTSTLSISLKSSCRNKTIDRTNTSAKEHLTVFKFRTTLPDKYWRRRFKRWPFSSIEMECGSTITMKQKSHCNRRMGEPRHFCISIISKSRRNIVNTLSQLEGKHPKLLEHAVFNNAFPNESSDLITKSNDCVEDNAADIDKQHSENVEPDQRSLSIKGDNFKNSLTTDELKEALDNTMEEVISYNGDVANMKRERSPYLQLTSTEEVLRHESLKKRLLRSMKCVFSDNTND